MGLWWNMIDFWLIVAVMGVGSVLSTIVPYLRKWYEKKVTKFDWRYLVDSMVAAAWEFVLMIPIYALWKPPVDITGDLLLLISAFCFGLGGYKLQTDVLKWINALRA